LPAIGRAINPETEKNNFRRVFFCIFHRPVRQKCTASLSDFSKPDSLKKTGEKPEISLAKCSAIFERVHESYSERNADTCM